MARCPRLVGGVGIGHGDAHAPLDEALGLAEQAQVGFRARPAPRRRPRRRCPSLPCRRRSPPRRRARRRLTSTGRPRMARACSSNSDRRCVASVTSPVSCGRGLTSENQTSSPLMNSSTPKMPRPPRLPVIFAAISRDLRNAAARHGHRLPRFDVIAIDLHMADRLAEIGLDRAAGADGPHRELGNFVVEGHEALDDDPPLPDTAARLGVIPGLLDVVGRLHQRLSLARRRHHRLDDAGIADAAAICPAIAACNSASESAKR